MSRIERTQCGTDMSAYFRPSRQSTSWIKLGQGTGWGVFSHRLPSKVLNARQRPTRISATPYGFSSVTPWGSSRAPRVRHQGRCIRLSETSKSMSRVAGANATYTTRPSAEATTSNRPGGVTVSRSQHLAPAPTGAHRSQTFTPNPELFHTVERHAGPDATGWPPERVPFPPERERGRVGTATRGEQYDDPGHAGDTSEHGLTSASVREP